VLAVDVVRNYANVVVQQPLVSSGVVFAAMHVVNEVFDSNIALLASFVTVVDYSSIYEPTGLSFS